jgi:GST-like protein
MKFFFHPSPNPMKVALLLEELQTPYELIGVDTFKGEQHLPAFLAINPNAKVPALIDGDATVFDSQAILLHLAHKHQRFLPTTAAGNAELLSWLMFIATGLSPFSGQAVHFLHHAPEDLPYAKNRYLKEVERHYRVLDQRLADHPYRRRHLQHRRHGPLGLGQLRAVHPWRKRPGGLPERQAPVR